ncbi:MAG: hypothetical protein WB992_11255 [Bryobacteraceae bacterium]
MTVLLERALQKLEEFPPDTQDAIAAQIIDSLADDQAWETSFARDPEKLSRLVLEAEDEIKRGETRPLDELL